MKRPNSLVLLALSLAWLSLAAASSSRFQTQTPTTEQAAFFEAKIRPVLVDKCQPCHGKDTQLANLRLDTPAGAQLTIVPGDPDKSLLIQAVRQTGKLKMPQGGKLKPEEIANLEAWVKMGAPWPGTAPVKEEKPLWSLKPVVKPPLPKIKADNPIDAFILAKLQAKKLTLSKPSDRRTLLRRVTYDLTGLPPTAAETDAFLADKTPTAYDKVVDRLLASPRYGERWARHWLDIARYADTKGYVFEEDRNYPNAYTYRDWVIDAFNKDLPYDQFIVQQLAADRLPEVANGDDKRPLAALGFLTIGRRFLNNPPDIIDDRIDVTMRGFQGFTVACARCHDHKFDPIPTQDYYSLYAVFASSQEDAAPISEKSIRDPWLAYSQRQTETGQAIHRLVTTQTKRLREMMKSENTLAPEVKQVLNSIREEVVPEGDNLAKISKAFEPAEAIRLAELQKSFAEAMRQAPATPEFAMAMTDRPNPSDGVIFKRGNPSNPGGPAPRRFLAALSKPERAHWDKDSGRLELARSIASRENPLTARVFVNRVWQDHFGAGLVRTPSDFGHQGEPPTHPELLDYLAATFMESGWSVKKLHRLIVTSATYRQASGGPTDADPENRLLSHMNRRRLDLEQMRDSLMAVSGRLDLRQVGGKSVDLWREPFSPRRAVYGFIERQNLPGVFRTFDFASPDSTNARRFLTTVPQQALFMMNSPFVVEQARALAARPEIQGAADDGQRIRRLYLQLFDRLPDADELAAGLAYLRPGSLQTLASEGAVWSYGYGTGGASFTPLGFFANGGYRVGRAFPDPSLGYLLLNAAGGHPGHDGAHAVIRRWTAPVTGAVKVEGVLAHPQAKGDGVRARLISSRNGKLGEWLSYNNQVKTDVATFTVQKGETLDFVVDPVGSDSFDAFSWVPTVHSADGAQTWSAQTGFAAPAPPPLTRLALYAQALLMTNEFMFVD